MASHVSSWRWRLLPALARAPHLSAELSSRLCHRYESNHPPLGKPLFGGVLLRYRAKGRNILHQTKHASTPLASSMQSTRNRTRVSMQRCRDCASDPHFPCSPRCAASFTSLSTSSMGRPELLFSRDLCDGPSSWAMYMRGDEDTPISGRVLAVHAGNMEESTDLPSAHSMQKSATLGPGQTLPSKDSDFIREQPANTPTAYTLNC